MNKKNWTFYATTDNVFWDANTTDKPSCDYVDNMNWQEIDLNLHHISPYLVRTQLNSDQYGLIKAVNKTTNKEIYYMLKNIVMFTDDNYNLEYELDTWTTYNLKMLDLDINVLVDRHQDYDDENCLKFDDEVLNSKELNFTEYKNIKHYAQVENNTIKPTDNENRWLEFENINDVVNAKYCLVLNDSKFYTQAYSIIPILTKNSSLTTKSKFSKIIEKDIAPVFIETKPDYTYSRTRFSDSEVQQVFNSIPFEFNLGMSVRYRENGVEKWDNVDYLFLNKDINLFYVESTIWGNHPNVKANFNIFYVNQLVYSKEIKVVQNQSTISPKCFFKFTPKEIFPEFKVSNSLKNVYELATNNSNKVMGVYLCPNVFTISKVWNVDEFDNKKFLTLAIEQQGNKINNIKLLSNLITSNKLDFNSTVPLHKSIYKFYDVNWMNNNINISKFINDKNECVLGDFINFTDTFNVYMDNINLPLDARILSLPSQQPFAIDTYKQYVQASLNSVNTGYAIQKQQTIMSGIQSGINSLMSAGSSFAQQNWLSGTSSLINGVFGQVNNVLGLKNYEKQMRAKYADADATMGNKLLFSTTQDSLWSYIINEEPKNYEVVMIKELTDDSIIQLNNTLLLNGIYNPKYFKLNDLPKTTKHLGFYYAKLNTTNFNQVFSKHINETREIKDIILANFAEFRVWDKIPSIE